MVSLTNEKSPYSITFRQKLTDIPDTKAKKVHISAWVKYLDTVDVKTKTALVISIDNTSESKNMQWTGLSIEKLIQIVPNQWQQITFDYIIPEMNLTGNESISICFWNQSKTSLMVDDFEVSFKP